MTALRPRLCGRLDVGAAYREMEAARRTDRSERRWSKAKSNEWTKKLGEWTKQVREWSKRQRTDRPETVKRSRLGFEVQIRRGSDANS
ncbi:hypothetical protein PENSPDRAFT_645649 [Peniophora sp. CONT]|nr:hypothetical protein PENSPDRAFT_645649 [Peniophora sp. CONT]